MFKEQKIQRETSYCTTCMIGFFGKKEIKTTNQMASQCAEIVWSFCLNSFLYKKIQGIPASRGFTTQGFFRGSNSNVLKHSWFATFLTNLALWVIKANFVYRTGGQYSLLKSVFTGKSGPSIRKSRETKIGVFTWGTAA